LIFTHPKTGEQLIRTGDSWVSPNGDRFPIINGIARFCEINNYADSFGRQWNLFQTTQIDHEGVAASPSADRLFAETGWTVEELIDTDILEVGSGAGRFSRAILERTKARLASVDYSSAVEANWANNGRLGGDRFTLAQASIYELPFPDNRFDKVLCLGVLQHTPYFEQSVHALVRKARKGGEIVVDFYAVRGWWTKVHAKYLLRPITRRIGQERLLNLVERNAPGLITVSKGLSRFGLGVLNRFVPIIDLRTLPVGLSREEFRQWVVLDTFDMFSPRYDNPQRIADVAAMFERGGAEVSFAENVETASGKAAVVRAIKR
jgi:SAM-dependent methyltransferase